MVELDYKLTISDLQSKESQNSYFTTSDFTEPCFIWEPGAARRCYKHRPIIPGPSSPYHIKFHG